MMTLVTLPQKAIIAVIVMKASTVALKTKAIFCVVMNSVFRLCSCLRGGDQKEQNLLHGRSPL